MAPTPPMIVDSHLDIAWNALMHGRGFNSPSPRSYMVNRDALARAGYGIVFATVFTAPRNPRGMAALIPYGYGTAREAYLLGRQQIGYYESVGLDLITTRKQLRAYLRDWKPGRLAAVLEMDCHVPHAVDHLAQLVVALGVRELPEDRLQAERRGASSAPPRRATRRSTTPW